MLYSLIGAAGLLTAAAVGAVATTSSQPAEAPAAAATVQPASVRTSGRHGDTAAEQRLEETVRAAIMADGPFFTADERALVERVCGMAPGSWNGEDVDMDEDHMRCGNGRSVNSPEIQAMLLRAGPRIAARVQRVMASPEIQSAISAVAHDATEQALREVRESFEREGRRH